MRRGALRALAAVVVLFCGTVGIAAADPSNDLREFRVGMTVAALPASGYVGLACAGAPDRSIVAWSGYAACPKDSYGLHAVSFRYDDAANPMAHVNDSYQGTRVAGHPVRLALLIGDDGRLDGMTIETDPDARLYMRKKAFLLADQVKARYGPAGWHCRDAKPTGDEEPIGGIFIKRHCEKDTDTRQLLLDQQLYRHAGQELQDFTGGTQLTVLAAKKAIDKPAMASSAPSESVSR